MTAKHDHPSHYGGADNPYETIKVLRAWLGPLGARAFCLGNALKYISRAGKKEGESTLDDLRKAKWYIENVIKDLEESG